MAGEDVPVMQPAAWMTKPPWFLVTGLPWPEDSDGAEMAEAALAIAPAVTQVVRLVGPDGQPIPLGHDLALMLDAGSQCAVALGKRVLFVSDITRWLVDAGRNWDHIGVDFATAQSELEQKSTALIVTVSRMAYTILCSTARNLTVQNASWGVAELTTDDREKVRTALEARLDADWSAYIRKVLANARSAAKSTWSSAAVRPSSNLR